MVEEVVIIIIGAGVVGASLMLALENQDLRVVLIDTHPVSAKISPDFDARTLALSPASVKILDMLGIWSSMQPHATPIHHIHISQKGRFGRVKLDSKREHPLGFVIEMQHINSALHQRLNPASFIAPASLSALDIPTRLLTLQHAGATRSLQAKLIIAADGSESTVRRLSGLPVKTICYQQTAIITNIQLARSHDYYAYERFTTAGPLALLPMTNTRASLVWALQPQQAQHMAAIADNDFLHALQQTAGYRMGRFTQVGKRTLYPLQQQIMPQQSAWPLVFIGNAAHTLHPVAGQGFNLGLRDAASLAQCIVAKGLDHNMLKYYETARQYDQKVTIAATHTLAKLFTASIPGAAILRSAGLAALDLCSPLKNILTEHASGFAGIASNLVSGIPLKEPNYE